LPRALVSLGSNISPEHNLPSAMALLLEAGSIRDVSRGYQSAAAGPPGQPDFVNVAVLVETDLAPEALRKRLRQIEAELGRVRTEDKFAPRPIDLDLVLYDDVVIDTAELQLPDPDILLRPYLAVTIAELDPARRHPVTGEPLAEIAARLGGAVPLTHRPDIDLSTGTSGAA
jgi:2-amino-4-hydroxy-6-hydroxymethyldihydropteridine diphosphokinase